MTKPLILAIEPDRGNASRLTSIASQVHAELRLTDSVEAALAALEERMPDLILTPPLLSARDDMALTGRMRELGDAAAHIQTLTIPTLQSAEPPLSGMFATLRRDKPRPRPAGPEACATTTFAEQVAVYLRGAMEARRRHSASSDAPDAPGVDASPAPRAPRIDELPSVAEFDLTAFISEQLSDPPPVPPVNEPSTFGDLSAFLPRVDQAATSAEDTLSHELTQFMSEEPLHRIDETSRTASDELSGFVSEAPPPAATGTRPTYDSWHFFDPDQPRFAALLAKLDTIAATGT